MTSRNPYFLDSPSQFGFSGGRSSAYMLAKTVKAHGGKLPDDVYVTFHNTGKERPETLEFVRDVGLYLGVHVYWTEFTGVYGSGLSWRLTDFEHAERNGEPFDRVIEYYRQYRNIEKGEPPILPNPANRMCTDRMKIKAASWFMRERGYDEWEAIIGVRADEERRYHKRMAANDRGSDRWTNYMPMFADGVTKPMVNAFWKSMPFDLRLDPNSDEGNCDACFLKAEHKIVRIFMKRPEAAEWWIRQERETGQRFRQDRPCYADLLRQADFYRAQMDLFQPDETREDLADCMCGD
ncbi:Nin-like protein [Burkholderia contaminans]|uniref:Nin-like protein n=1 Tax=Burkholderia contaminans TaxID=488447 RepID=UPI001CF2EF98|nr:Nin-like protein [Burkholderia contaminans]MCA7883202.1 Nin-like protein [Burkholderia contaminans]